MSDWSFITNHGLLLAVIARGLGRTAREIGDVVGITERSAHKIISDLEAAGYVTKTKVGRLNSYQIHPDVPLRDEASDAAVGELLVVLGWRWGEDGAGEERRPLPRMVKSQAPSRRLPATEDYPQNRGAAFHGRRDRLTPNRLVPRTNTQLWPAAKGATGNGSAARPALSGITPASGEQR